MFVNLAPDGSRFLFIGEDLEGRQTLSEYSLTDGSTSVLREVSYDQGVLSNPRIAPDGEKIAYIVQKGQPESGLTFTLDLLARPSARPKTLAKGNLVMAVPAWSPDGKYIAFTRNDEETTLRYQQDDVPDPMRGNVWIVPAEGGKETQITFIDGLARSPAWASDSKTLAFVTHDGQVGLTSIDQPGQVWQAAGPSAGYPDLTSVFILP